MSEERRSAARARISGARVTYESAAGGDRVETDALNLGRGGLFVLTDNPLPVGKRIALEIQVAGELVPWPALGRVIWARERTDGDRKPSGMGVKLIDVDDDALETIERLVTEREDVLPDGDEAAPPAEVVATVVTTPIVSLAPEREKTIMGIGMAVGDGASAVPTTAPLGGDTAPVAAERNEGPVLHSPPVRAREPSIAFDLVTKERTPSTPPPRPRPEVRDEAPPQKALEAPRTSAFPGPAKREGGGAGRWLVVFLLVAAAAATAYWYLGNDSVRLPGQGAEPSATEPAGTAPPVHLPPPSASTATEIVTSTPATPTAIGSAPVLTTPPSPVNPPAMVAPATATPSFSAQRRPPATPFQTVPAPPGHGPAMPSSLDAGAKK